MNQLHNNQNNAKFVLFTIAWHNISSDRDEIHNLFSATQRLDERPNLRDLYSGILHMDSSFSVMQYLDKHPSLRWLNLYGNGQGWGSYI